MTFNQSCVILVDLTTWYRWMHSWNISLSTESKVRTLARDLVGPNLASEVVPFTFSMVEEKRSEKHQWHTFLIWVKRSNNSWTKMNGKMLHSSILQ